MKIHFILLMFNTFAMVACSQGVPSSQVGAPAPQTQASAPAPQFAVLDVESYSDLLSKTQGALLLDVRTPGEYASGHIPGAVNIDFYAPDFAEQIGALDKTRDVFLYCASGNRSGQAMRLLQKAGFRSVKDLKGGFGGWARAGGAVER